MALKLCPEREVAVAVTKFGSILLTMAFRREERLAVTDRRRHVSAQVHVQAGSR